jgi:hypothetical protein
MIELPLDNAKLLSGHFRERRLQVASYHLDSIAQYLIYNNVQEVTQQVMNPEG